MGVKIHPFHLPWICACYGPILLCESEYMKFHIFELEGKDHRSHVRSLEQVLTDTEVES